MPRTFWKRLARFVRSEEFRAAPLGSVYRRLRWRGHWLLRPRRALVVGVPDGELELARSSASAGIYINGGRLDPDTAAVFRAFLRPAMVAIDCGAHIGEYTLLFSRAVGGSGSVHSFEPHPDIVRVLERNIARNRLNNVDVTWTAVAERVGELQFGLADDPTEAALTDRPGPGPVAEVPTLSLDSYCEAIGLRRVDLLKIDVEGAESRVLTGADRLLSELRPSLVFVECHSKEQLESVEAILARRAYEVKRDDRHVHTHVWARMSATIP